jgi:hypothetical protein
MDSISCTMVGPEIGVLYGAYVPYISSWTEVVVGI